MKIKTLEKNRWSLATNDLTKCIEWFCEKIKIDELKFIFILALILDLTLILYTMTN